MAGREYGPEWSGARGPSGPSALVGLGAGLLVLGSALSLVGSPLPAKGLPWAVQIWVGAALTLGAWLWSRGRPISDGEHGTPPGRSRRGPAAAVWVTLGLGYAAVLVLPTIVGWPANKLPALAPVYARIPSLLPLLPDWAARGASPNQVGGVLASVAAFAVCLALYRRPRQGAAGHPPTGGAHPPTGGARRVRRAAAPLALAAGLLVVLSGSRAALVALACAVLTAVVLRYPRGLRVVVGLCVGGLAAAALRPALATGVISGLLRDEPLATKLLSRMDIWSSVLRAVADHPYAGIGLGALNDVIPARYPYGSVGLTYSVSQAHNALLDTALAMGWAAALGYLCLVAGVLWGGVGSVRRGSGLGAPIVGYTSAMIVNVVFGITDSLSFSSPSSLVIWVVSAGSILVGSLQRTSCLPVDAEAVWDYNREDDSQYSSHNERTSREGAKSAAIERVLTRAEGRTDPAAHELLPGHNPCFRRKR